MRTTVRIRTRDRWLAALALLAFLLVCFAATATPNSAAPVSQSDNGGPRSAAKPPSYSPTNKPEKPPHSHHYHLSLPWHLLRQLFVLAAAAGLILAIWLIVRVLPQLGARRAARRAPPTEDALPDPVVDQAEDVSRALSAALTAIELGDVNRAIVSVWIRLEQIAEEVGFARQPWETSTEVVTRWLRSSSIPEQPLDELAELYREARYSDHVMSRESVEHARSTLVRLRAAFTTPASTESSSG